VTLPTVSRIRGGGGEGVDGAAVAEIDKKVVAELRGVGGGARRWGRSCRGRR
jgi:hypothetical protein